MHNYSNSFLGMSVVIVLATMFCFAVVSPALAEDDSTSFGEGLKSVGEIAKKNELGGAKSSKEIIQSITKWLLSLIGTIAVISLLYGGFLYITSQGDESKTEQAKAIILYSIIGIIIIGLSAIIVNVVISLTQI